MRGISIVDASARTTPKVEGWSIDERPTAIRMTGGVGDALMVAQVAKSAGKPVHMYVQANQVELIRKLCPDTFSSQTLNRPDVRIKYGGIFDCPRLFASSYEIRNNEYYDTIEKYLGVARTRIQPLTDVSTGGKPYAVIHAGSSNPNRRIPKESWEAVALALVAQGLNVKWLGTVGDFGITCSPSSTCAWQFYPELEHQVEIVANASWFFGNDSGFCHLAGMHDVRGHVFFTNTNPDHVLSRYPKLVGHAPPNTEYSRSLRVDDPQAAQALAHWTTENVLKACRLPQADRKWSQTSCVGAPLPLVLKTDTLPDEYASFCEELRNRGIVVTDASKVDAMKVTFQPTCIKLYLRNNTVFTISNQVDEFIRALHEIQVI